MEIWPPEHWSAVLPTPTYQHFSHLANLAATLISFVSSWRVWTIAACICDVEIVSSRVEFSGLVQYAKCFYVISECRIRVAQFEVCGFYAIHAIIFASLQIWGNVNYIFFDAEWEGEFTLSSLQIHFQRYARLIDAGGISSPAWHLRAEDNFRSDHHGRHIYFYLGKRFSLHCASSDPCM